MINSENLLHCPLCKLLCTPDTFLNTSVYKCQCGAKFYFDHEANACAYISFNDFAYYPKTGSLFDIKKQPIFVKSTNLNNFVKFIHISNLLK